jgi:hypothetical protein
MKRKRWTLTTRLNGTEMRQFRAVARYVRGFCGPIPDAEVLRFLVRNWMAP